MNKYKNITCETSSYSTDLKMPYSTVQTLSIKLHLYTRNSKQVFKYHAISSFCFLGF